MSDDDLSVTVAAQRAADARRRLSGTLVDLQARLNPRALAQEAAQDLREAGEELAREGLATVKRHPLTVAGILAAIGLIVFRGPVGKFVTRLFDRTPARETPKTPPRLPPKPRTRGTSR